MKLARGKSAKHARKLHTLRVVRTRKPIWQICKASQQLIISKGIVCNYKACEQATAATPRSAAGGAALGNTADGASARQHGRRCKCTADAAAQLSAAISAHVRPRSETAHGPKRRAHGRLGDRADEVARRKRSACDKKNQVRQLRR